MRTTTVSNPSRQGAAPESGGDVLFGASSGCPPVSSTLPGEAQPVIEVHDLTKRYGTHTIHEHLDLTVGQSEIIALVGGSGSGKTTLIRQIIGLEAPTSGHIRIFGHDITMIDRRAAHLLRRRSGMLFQRGALFSAMTVFDNIAQPLRELHTLSEDLIRDVVMYKLEMVGLSGRMANRMPSELSGGMIKRVGIARAIALEPELLFLDEPTAGLDPIGAAKFDELIRELADTMGLTVFLITHDLDSLYATCDRVAVLAEKKVIAVGTIPELLATEHPWIQDYFNGPRGRAAAGCNIAAERQDRKS